ncbi:MAG: hypothetical protein ACI8QF_004805, partial [Limisphaerales bacterium]
ALPATARMTPSREFQASFFCSVAMEAETSTSQSLSSPVYCFLDGGFSPIASLGERVVDSPRVEMLGVPRIPRAKDGTRSVHVAFHEPDVLTILRKEIL